jgi:hypothetical protein
MKTIICITAYVFFQLICYAVPASPAPKEFDSLQLVTGFHSHLDKPTGFEFRILEMDGSATVAMNPINLYLVVTNNSSGSDSQSSMIVLPKVSTIESIRFADLPDKIQIDALLDRVSKDGSAQQTVPVTIYVSVPIKDGKIPQVIDVSVKEREKLEQAAP